MRTIEQKLEESYRAQERQREQRAVAEIERNPRYFFSYAKSRAKTTSSIGPLLKGDGTYTDNSKEMGEILKSQYDSVFSEPLASLAIANPNDFFMHETLRLDDTSKLSDITMTPLDFETAIDCMPMHSAPGPDSWNSVFIKNCKKPLSHALHVLWRASLDTGIIPQQLKSTDIAPLHKGGSKAIAKNYRPIALTSHIIKIFERVLRNRIASHMESNNLHNPGQHGFRAGRSCLSQLLDNYDMVLDALEDKQNADVVYTDFAKAFDKCDHGVIAHKMRAKGITGKVGRWVFNFLTNRTQRVVVNQVKSEPAPVKSSVPQGTVLAPILFLILISDIDGGITNSTVSSFADDTRIYMRVASIEDTVNLQADISQIFRWASDNNMMFNEEKFQLLRYGKIEEIKTSSDYKTNSDHTIERKTTVRDLGVTMSEDLTFKDHNSVTITTARKMIGWITRTFRTRDAKPMMILYKSLVLSRLEYCCILTAPSKAGEIAELENVQRTFTARIHSIRHLNYWERLNFLNLYSLERRRERYIIIYTWKILEGLVPNQRTEITPYDGKRLGRRCRLPPLKSRGALSTLRDTTISVRGPRLFNALPPHIRGITNRPLAVFKRELDKFLKSVPDQPGCGEYVRLRAAGSNSLVDQAMIHREAWSGTGPRGR